MNRILSNLSILKQIIVCKQTLVMKLITLIVLMILSACSAVTARPEADLWGKWSFAGGEGGNLDFADDLSFQEDGVLTFVGSPHDQMTYVVIAPGRIKISFDQYSEILNYRIENDTLRLFFDKGHNQYQRHGVPIAAVATQSGTLSETPAVTQPAPIEPTSVSTPTQETPSVTPTSTFTLIATLTPTITPTPTETLGLGSRRLNDVDLAEMVFVPAGFFVMGSESPSAERNERPARDVFLDAFWIYQYPVTNQQFAEFVQQTGYKTTAEQIGISWVFEYGTLQVPSAYWRAPEGGASDISGREDHPVVHISYDDAAAYCAWAGGRLPSEAEWEKAARGDTGRIYPWGNSQVTGEKANFCDRSCPMDWANRSHDDGFPRTSPVGSFLAGTSIYGTRDMIGNVWEWVADWYDRDYYATAPLNNPTGPEVGEYRVIRGGSWVTSPNYLRAAYRYLSDPYDTSNDHGFRCVMPATP